MAPDFFGDKPRIALIVIIISAILFLATALYLIPIATPINLTLDAIKVDSNGEVIGTAQISLNGYKFDYLFQKSRLDVYIHPFDDYAYFKPSRSQENGQSIIGVIRSYSFPEAMKALEPEWKYVFYGGIYADTSDICFAKVAFSPDLDRWMIADESEKFYFMASVSGSADGTELISYFQLAIG